MVEYLIQHWSDAHAVWMTEFTSLDEEESRDRFAWYRDVYPHRNFRLLKCEILEEHL